MFNALPGLELIHGDLSVSLAQSKHLRRAQARVARIVQWSWW